MGFTKIIKGLINDSYTNSVSISRHLQRLEMRVQCLGFVENLVLRLKNFFILNSTEHDISTAHKN